MLLTSNVKGSTNSKSFSSSSSSFFSPSESISAAAVVHYVFYACPDSEYPSFFFCCRSVNRAPTRAVGYDRMDTLYGSNRAAIVKSLSNRVFDTVFYAASSAAASSSSSSSSTVLLRRQPSTRSRCRSIPFRTLSTVAIVNGFSSSGHSATTAGFEETCARGDGGTGI